MLIIVYITHYYVIIFIIFLDQCYRFIVAKSLAKISRKIPNNTSQYFCKYGRSNVGYYFNLYWIDYKEE